MISCFRKITLSWSKVRFIYFLFKIFLSPDGIGFGMCFLRYIRSDSRGACTARMVSLLFVSSTTAIFSSKLSCTSGFLSWLCLYGFENMCTHFFVWRRWLWKFNCFGAVITWCYRSWLFSRRYKIFGRHFFHESNRLIKDNKNFRLIICNWKISHCTVFEKTRKGLYCTMFVSAEVNVQNWR